MALISAGRAMPSTGMFSWRWYSRTARSTFALYSQLSLPFHIFASRSRRVRFATSSPLAPGASVRSFVSFSVESTLISLVRVAVFPVAFVMNSSTSDVPCGSLLVSIV